MLAVAFAACPLVAWADAPHGSVEIVGNARTEASVIVNAAEIPEGPLDDAQLAAVRQRLLNLKLFETVEITARDLQTQPALTIKVKERWTLFPIPFVMSSSRGVSGGVFVLESNLFGLNKTLVLGGSYAGWGATGFALYQDPSVAGTRATLSASAVYSDNRRERRIDDRVVTKVDDARAESSLLAGYRIGRRTYAAAGGFVSRVAGSTATMLGGDGAPSADAMLATSYLYGWAASLEYRGADLHGYYDEGLTAKLQMKQARHELGAARDVLDASGRVQYTRAFLPNQATTFILQGDLIAGGHSLLDVRLLGGRAGSRGFEAQALWADRSAMLTIDHQVPVFARGWGIATLGAFVDLGRVELDGERTTFATPGAGARLYLPRMNFPAIGVDVSYSLDSKRLFTTVAVGLSF